MTQKLVLYVHPSNELYGADRSLLRLVAGISGERYRPSVVVANDLPYSASLTTELSRLGIEHFRDDLGVLRRKYRSPVGAVNFFCRTMSSVIRLALWCHGVAIVHSNSMAVLAGGLSARLTGVPHIWHIREIITEPPWLNCFMGRAMYHLSDRAIAVSRAAQDSLLAVEPRLSDHLSVIYNGIDPSPYDAVNKETVAELRRSWHVTDGDVVVGMVGRVSAWKGQGSLLAAAALVLRKQPNTRLVMVGGTVPGEEWRGRVEIGCPEHTIVCPCWT